MSLGNLELMNKREVRTVIHMCNFVCDIKVSNSWNMNTLLVCSEKRRERKVFLKVEEQVTFLPTRLQVTPRMLSLYVHVNVS